MMGALQDQPGSDGIRDTSFSEGKVTDTYPHIYPFGWHDPVNFAPFILPPTPTDAIEDEMWQADYEANDGNSDPLTYSVHTNASWLSIGPLNGTLFGIPTNADVGTCFADVTVDDGRGGLAKDNITITILNTNDPPCIIGTDVPAANEDELYEVFYTADDPDPTPDILTWAFSSNATWLDFDDATGRLYGTPTNDDLGSFYVTLNLSDDKSGWDQRTFNVSVFNTNDPPVINAVDAAGLTVAEDQPYSYEFSFTDVDVPANPVTWDVITDAPFLAMNSQTGILSGTPSNEHVDLWDVNVTADDGIGGTAFLLYVLEVTNVNDPPTISNRPAGGKITADEDSEFSYEFGVDDADPTNDTFTFGLSTNAGFLNLDEKTGLLKGTPGNEDVGSWWVNVTVTDDQGGSTFINFTLTVQNTNDPPEESNINLDQEEEDLAAGEPIEFEADEGLDPDQAHGDLLTYEWDFGDGNTAIGFTVTHTYDQPGDYVVTLNVTDVNGQFKVSTLVITVAGEIVVSESVEVEGATVEINAAIEGDGYFEMKGVSQTEMDELTSGETEGTIGIFVDITLEGGDLIWLNITITYGILPEGVDESSIQIYYWDGVRWTRAENTGVDLETNTAWANVTHLTIFAPKAEQSMEGEEEDKGYGIMPLLIIIAVAMAILVILIIVVIVVVIVKKPTPGEEEGEEKEEEGKDEEEKAEKEEKAEGEEKDEEEKEKELPPPPPDDEPEVERPTWSRGTRNGTSMDLSIHLAVEKIFSTMRTTGRWTRRPSRRISNPPAAI
jgi:uncharacterized membrane protein